MSAGAVSRTRERDGSRRFSREFIDGGARGGGGRALRGGRVRAVRIGRARGVRIGSGVLALRGGRACSGMFDPSKDPSTMRSVKPEGCRDIRSLWVVGNANANACVRVCVTDYWNRMNVAGVYLHSQVDCEKWRKNVVPSKTVRQ